MEPGDLIRWRDQVWLVRKVDRALETAIVESERSMEVLASDADAKGECQLWCTPSRQWPSASLPQRVGASRLVSVCHGGSPLTRFTDWVKLDDFQIGGALYLNPRLNLGYGDRLAVIFVDPNAMLFSVPVNIPRNFVPATEKRRAQPPVQAVQMGPEPVTTSIRKPALFQKIKREP